jgi:glycosyltransferase involved in cell wall biosynthesis
MELIRVLHVLAGLNSGGTESFIMNVYRKLDRKKVQFDFLIRQKSDEALIVEVEALGGRVYMCSSFPRHFIQNYFEVKSFFKMNAKKYKAVHVHANSLIYTLPLSEAKRNNISCRIIHSHNTQTANVKMLKYIHMFNKAKVAKLATDYFACSNLAGKWMFNVDFEVINNAVDVAKFKFSEVDRNIVRQDFGLSGKFVIGHIGRFTEQKNHNFLIDFFNKIHQKLACARLLLIGEGELLLDVKSKVKKLNLEDKVIFCGVRKDIPALLSAMDFFLLPSHFEGLGIVLVEAQASGLKAIASKGVVPLEAKVTELLKYLPLNESVDIWADEVLQYSNGYTRENMYRQIKKNNYEIGDLVKQLQNFYLK